MQDYIPKVIDINGEIGTVVVKQYDNLSRYIHLQIMDNDLSTPMNLVGCEVRLYADLIEDIGYIDGEVADGENGVITFLLPNSLTQKAGEFQAEVWITNADELSSISTKPFTITVEKSLRDGQRLEATGQFSALDNALMQVAILGRKIESIAQMVPSDSISAEKLSAALQYPNNIISTGTVAAMLDCAESYFNYAYTADGQDSGIIYESNKGLYSPSLGTNAASNRYSIVCSSFVNAVVNGIHFENSRYTGRTKNVGHRWGLVFDDTVEFGKTIGDWSTQDDIDAHNFEVEQRYLISSALAKYAAEHDCLYMIDGKQNIRAGDVLFSRKKDYYPVTRGAHIPSQDNYYPYPTDDYKPYAFMGIDHVSIAVNVSGDYVTLIEAWPSQKADGKDVGVRISYRNLITHPIGESVYICGATLPIGDAGYMPKVLETLYDIAGDTTGATLIHEFKQKAEQGFYTVVCHGKCGGEPYVSVRYDGSSTNTWQSSMHRVGDDYYLTVYVQKPGVIAFRMLKDNTYDISEVTLYRGYADITAQQPHLNRLESGDDLDNCYEGEWYCQNKATAEAIVHTPLSEATGGFYLDAKRMTNGERYMQTLWYAASPGKMYVRMYMASGWMDWLVFSGKAVSDNTDDNNGTGGNTTPSTGGNTTPSTGDNWPTATEIVNDIKVGWTLGGALECSYEKVKTDEMYTDSEGLAYEKGWGNPETTEYTFKAVKEMGFNAVRIPVTWNHHLIDDGNGNVTISSYFLNRVKKVVKWAIDEGLYVVLNSHYDTATFSSSQSSNYAATTTGLTWETAIPYQLFNADNTPLNSTQCGYITKLWTQIANAFKDYGYRLLFEGFNEIQGNPRDGSAPTSAQITNVNALNAAFINAVRAVSGNEQRTLLCQTYNALNNGDAVTGFNVTDDSYVILDARLFTDDTSEISRVISALKSKGYPVVLGATGWNTAPSGDEKSDFVRTFAQAVKTAGTRLFWWDDCGSNYKLLDRAKTNAQTSGVLWSKPETAKALVEGSGGNPGTGLCAASDTSEVIGGIPITSPETATEVVNNIKVGWNLGNTLDCSYDPVRLRDDSGTAVLGTEYEGIGYEIGWGDVPATTQAMFEALVNAGFNAIRIPVTWNHHLRDAALPDDWGQDKTYTSQIDEYPNLSGNIIISPYFLNRVKTVVNYALNAGFRYVIINSHHDTANYNVNRPFGYAKKVTGLPWITETPYQLFHASNQLGSNLASYDSNMTAEDDFNNMCGYMRQLWTLIATAFKDYDYRVIFEGFNEILKYTRSWEEPTALQVARVNGFNNAFVSAVRNAGGSYNANRILSCETYAAYASNDALSDFSVTDSAGGDRIILQAHFYHNNPAEFANAAQRINENVGIPAIFGEVGWDVNSNTPVDLYNFGYNLVQQAKSKGVKVFWWDNNKQGNGTNYYGLLNRWNTDSSGTEWHKPELLRGLIDGSK